MVNARTIEMITKNILETENINPFPKTKELEQLVTSLGGKCFAAKIKGKSSLVIPKQAKENMALFAINYNSELDAFEKKYAIAKELGHLVLHALRQDGNIKKTEDLCNPSNEYEAKQFALTLLMPKEIFTNAHKLCTEGCCADITSIADFFEVSSDMVEERKKMLRL